MSVSFIRPSAHADSRKIQNDSQILQLPDSRSQVSGRWRASGKRPALAGSVQSGSHSLAGNQKEFTYRGALF